MNPGEAGLFLDTIGSHGLRSTASPSTKGGCRASAPEHPEPAQGSTGRRGLGRGATKNKATGVTPSLSGARGEGGVCSDCPLRLEIPLAECFHGAEDWFRAKRVLLKRMDESQRTIARLSARLWKLGINPRTAAAEEIDDAHP